MHHVDIRSDQCGLEVCSLQHFGLHSAQFEELLLLTLPVFRRLRVLENNRDQFT